MTKESILVTGTDRNIGSEVINQLSSEGVDLRLVGGLRAWQNLYGGRDSSSQAITII
jgi:short-subunit dehydrogenase